MAPRRPRRRTRKTRHAPDGTVVERPEDGLTVHRVEELDLKAHREAVAWYREASNESDTFAGVLDRIEREAQEILREAGCPDTVGPHAEPAHPSHPGGRRIARLVRDTKGVQTPAWFAAQALEAVDRIRGHRRAIGRRLDSPRALRDADGLALAAYRLRGLVELAGFKADFEPDVLLGVKQRARGRKGGHAKRDQEDYERTRAAAADLWKSEPSLTGKKVAERLRSRGVTSAGLSTVRGWIRDLNPSCQLPGI